LADLSAIFAKLHYYDSYPFKEDLSNSFRNWCSKYKIIHAEMGFSFEDKLQIIGIYSF